ncbi:hypothetical protein B0H14DRAFT_3788594 [Mycena olivaceomarginata]|nr:hypothetical protein B0H14DRAFT_3788594 [Mycena olivaceomarginata]
MSASAKRTAANLRLHSLHPSLAWQGTYLPGAVPHVLCPGQAQAGEKIGSANGIARERDTREHKRELYNWGVPGVPLSMPDTEWDAVNGPPVQTPTPREPPERVFRTKQSVSLGSYVYPVTPFPYAFLAELADVPAATTGKLLEDKTTGTSTLNPLATATKDKPDVTSDAPATSEPEDPELLALKTHTTLLFPTAHLPLGQLKPVRLWGGGCREVVGEPQQQRQIYTDNSDPLCVAVHTGFMRWSALGRVRREGRDARVEVRVVRVLGAASKGEVKVENRHRFSHRFCIDSLIDFDQESTPKSMF